jgi:hypothetical protein
MKILIIISIMFIVPFHLSCGGGSSEPSGPPDLPCRIVVTSPTSSSNWTVGQTREISWSRSGTCDSDVTIELYQGTLRTCTIENSTPNDGSEGWLVSNCGNSGSNYRIKITIIDTGVSSFSGYFQYNRR